MKNKKLIILIVLTLILIAETTFITIKLGDRYRNEYIEKYGELDGDE